MENLFNLKYIVSSVLYSFIGIFILVLSFWVIEKITPENLWQEILVNKNNALAIMAAAFMLAVAIIIASAIHG
jgi:putative membrane protein